jgi:hypothetical protein
MLMQTSLQLSTTALKKKEWLVLILMRKHNLIKFRKTNQGTSINLKPIKKGIEWFLVKYYPKDMQLKMVN